MFNLKTFNKQFPNEKACIDWLVEHRWGGEPICSKCGTVGAYFIATRNLFKCKGCKKQYTIKIGTIFEDSPIQLKDWFLAIYLITSLKKGISSIQLSKFVGCTQKSAWYMLHRIRHAVNIKSFQAPLKGIVEVDETYIGGVQKGKRGRGAKGKTAVAGIIERKGCAKVQVVDNVKAKTLMPFIQGNVETGAMVMTDELRSYNKLMDAGYSHESVNHSDGQFVSGNAHTNSAENFWKHMKRGIDAIYIHVSKKHLQKYCDEYAFRFNERNLDDADKFTAWFKHCEKRITYKGLTA